MTSALHRIGLAVAVAAGALVAGLDVTAPLDRVVLDAQFAFLRQRFPQPAPADVIVVGIDEATAAEVAEPLALWHRHIGDFLTAAAQAGARGVAVDLVLPDRSYDAIAPGYDRHMTEGLLAMRRVGVLVLAQTVDEGGRERPIHTPFRAAAGPDSTGFALWPVDPDGVVRRFEERLGARGEAVPTLVGQLARRLGTAPGDGLINFALGDRFGYVPFRDVLAWQRAGARDRVREAVGGKIVMLGSVLPFTDHHRASVALGAWAPESRTNPGVLLHAQALRSVLEGRLVRPAPAWLTLLIGAALALAWFGATRLRYAALTAAVVVAFAALLGTVALAHDVFVPTVAFATAGLIAVGGRVGLDTAISLRGRRRLRSVFGGYVSPQVMREIEAGRLEGRASARAFICVLFLDVRGFTTRSETMAPEPMIELLNGLFEAATDAVHAHGGTVDKFTGDGIMAFFGAPAPLANPCQSAFDAARGIAHRVDDLNVTLAARKIEPLAIGLGLACGEAVLGHVGAERRHAYTAIGDCVNVAARLEGLTKDLGYPLVLSSEVAARIADDGRLARLGAQTIKGHSPVEAFGWR